MRTRPARSVSAPNHLPAGEDVTPAVQITVLLAIRSPATMTPSLSIFSTLWPRWISTPSFCRWNSAATDRLGAKVPRTFRAPSSKTIRAEVGSIRRNSERNDDRTKIASAGANQNEGQQIAVKIDIFFGLSLLEGAEDFVSNTDGIGQGLQARSKLFKFVVSEITGTNTSRQNKVIVRHRHIFAICVVYKNAALRLIHTGDLAHDHRCIFMSSQYLAEWRTHLRRREYCRRYLIKKRRKNRMVRSIDENDFDRRFAKGFGRSQTTKTAADNHHPRCLRRLLIRTIDRIETSIVHPSFLKLLRPKISENLCFFADRDSQLR